MNIKVVSGPVDMNFQNNMRKILVSNTSDPSHPLAEGVATYIKASQPTKPSVSNNMYLD